MKPVLLSAPCLALTVLAAAQPVHAQLDAATIRGLVLDVQGQPLAGVKVEMEFKGESRQKIVRTVSTDKKGAFIRVGLKPGQWRLAVSKDGYKAHTLETYLSGGGVSEIPPITLAPAPTAAGAASPASAVAPLDSQGPERAKQLGEDYKKAMEAMQAGRAAEAEAMLKAIVAELPNLAEAHYNLGYLYDQRNAHADAEAEFRKAIELQPQASDAYVALATLLGRTQRGEEALKLLADASGRFAQDGRYQFALGAVAFNLGRNAESEPAFLKAVELDPANVEAYFFLGSLAIARNDLPAALEHLQKYVASAGAGAPNLEAARSLLATLGKSRKK